MTIDWLDIFTTVLGLAYIWLEYRASIWLWLVGIVMPALDIWLYWRHGLKKTRKEHKSLPIIHMPHRYFLPATVFFFIAWGVTYYVLITWTNSTVPVLDALTNALSFVGLWALARKFLEQWLFWIIVDAICTYLYITKGIPFKAGLYGLYVIIAIAGYYKWKKMTKITKYEKV